MSTLEDIMSNREMFSTTGGYLEGCHAMNCSLTAHQHEPCFKIAQVT